MSLSLTEIRAERATVRLVCRRCGRQARPTLKDLIEKHGADASIFALARRMRCSECGTPPDVFLWLDCTEPMRAAIYARAPEVYVPRDMFWPDPKKRR